MITRKRPKKNPKKKPSPQNETNKPIIQNRKKCNDEGKKSTKT